MEIDEIVRAIEKCRSVDDLNAIALAAKKQVQELGKKERLRKADEAKEAWEQVSRKAKNGMVLTASRRANTPCWIAPSRASPANIKRFSFTAWKHLTVRAVQPRKKLIWVSDEAGVFYGLTPQNLAEMKARLYADEFRAKVAEFSGKGTA